MDEENKEATNPVDLAVFDARDAYKSIEPLLRTLITVMQDAGIRFFGHMVVAREINAQGRVEVETIELGTRPPFEPLHVMLKMIVRGDASCVFRSKQGGLAVATAASMTNDIAPTTEDVQDGIDDGSLDPDEIAENTGSVLTIERCDADEEEEEDTLDKIRRVN